MCSAYDISNPRAIRCLQAKRFHAYAPSQCTVTILINGVSYTPGQAVQLPLGTTALQYKIVDANGDVAVDSTSVTVVSSPLYV